MAYNRFGALHTSVVSLYPDSVAADFGGQTIIEESIDRAVDRIVNALTPGSYKALTEPDLELVVRRATAGLTSATLGLKPIVSGSLHLWTGQPTMFNVKPVRLTDFSGGGITELAAASFSVVLATGVVATPALVVEDQVYASYQVDTGHASFSVPSLARLAVRGAAAEVGDKLFSEANQEWALVERYRDSFDADLAAFKDGTMVPDELRAMRWWSEVDRSGPGLTSVRLFRGG